MFCVWVLLGAYLSGAVLSGGGAAEPAVPCLPVSAASLLPLHLPVTHCLAVLCGGREKLSFTRRRRDCVRLSHASKSLSR